MEKIIRLQDAKFKLLPNNNNETSIFIEQSIANSLGLVNGKLHSFKINKENLLKALAFTYSLQKDLYKKQETVLLDNDWFKKEYDLIISHFQITSEYTVEINLATGGRFYMKSLKQSSGLNIRNFLIQDHFKIIFSNTNNDLKIDYSENQYSTDSESENIVNESSSTYGLENISNKKEIIYSNKKLRTIIFEGYKYAKNRFKESTLLKDYELKNSSIGGSEYKGLSLPKYFNFEILIGLFENEQTDENLKSSNTNRFINEKIKTLEFENSYFTSQWNESNGRGLSLGNFNKFLKDVSINTLEIIKEDENFHLVKKVNFDNNSQNKIIYGPPGTGKTYSTVDKVVSIISPNEYQKDNHKANKLIYDNLYKNKNVLFTTFHQSMSYEDFVEGIKPKFQDESDDEKEELTYEISPGIFKIACARAAYNSYKENKITNQTSYEFEDVYQAFIEMALSHISANDFINCKTITGKDVEIYRINKNDSIKARASGSIATHVAPLTKENIQKLYDTYDSINEIRNLQQIKDTVGVSPRLTEFYAVFRSLLEFKQTTFQPIKDEEVVEKELNDDEIVRQFDAGLYTKSVKEHGKSSTPVVLVIDEINRGNVSAIFGELITLIEGDKRIGQANEIQLILPYSKVPFSVPPNLFILGTMNTADRSVEALDTALRRRFNFEEMMPNPNLLKTRGDGNGIVAEFKLWKILKTINERIEVLIDRDHTIGHAYLWDVKTIKDLKFAFHNKIIPLLQEYFFGNYAKMELVIGNKFFNQKKKNEKIDFAVRNSELDIEPGIRYELLNIQDFSDEQMKAAISNLLAEESKDEE